MMKKLPALTLSAVALFIIALMLTLPSITASVRSVVQPPAEDELDKDAMHARMKQLQSRIEILWKQFGKSRSEEVRAEIDAAQQEFDSISAQLGGDRPVAEASEAEQARALNSEAEPQVAANAPIGCPMTTTTFSDSPTTFRIPASGTSGTVTRTITVSGIGTSVWDVDAITNITHTACADLDITLKSPAGTIVTLTTDNGGTLDNVFNGTVWDDQANPGGQVPYFSNNGLASDHAYVNNTLASPLVPEEAMGAFIGENPNGTWTLTITDDSSGDIGNLASWSLKITTLGAGTFTTQAVFPSADSNLPAVISNSCLSGPVTSTVNVAGMGLHVGIIKLRTEITHFNPEDMDITLTSPQGTVATITTDNGSFLAPTGLDGTTFSDRANLGGQVPYGNCLIFFPCNQGLATDRVYSLAGTATGLVPEEAMAAFNGENPNGVWTLKVVDDSCNLLIGSLKAWSLDITTTTCCSITCPANISQGNDPGQCGANVMFSPTDNGYCSMVTCSPASGTFFPKGTTTVNCTTAAGPACSFTVTVNDTQPPSITCPGNITKSTDPNLCTAVTTFMATATDNCPGVGTPTCSPASGTAFPKGTTTVTCMVSDASGNSASCSFTVTVNDTQPPLITCPANLTVITARPCDPTVVVTYTTPTPTDNCPGVTASCTPASGTLFPVGTTTVTCKATDTSGNMATCSFTVTVFDVRLQDDSNSNNTIVFNSFTGDYRACGGGTMFTGKGTIVKKGCMTTLTHNTPTTRVSAGVDPTSQNKGNASVNSPPGVMKFTIYDRDIRNDTKICP